MSDYYNEAGEPLMTASQARQEAMLDEQNMYDDYYCSHDYDCYEEEQDEEDSEDEDNYDQDPVEDFGFFGEMGMMED
jgi:hypothetical protein|tara:strand:- start:1235 stop:1465 length:231 start_codon:yes stop_codon:yes gene_type:complete